MTNIRLIGSLTFAFLGSLTSIANAQTAVWDGEADGNWNTASNWVGNVAPTSGDVLNFAGEAEVVTTNDIAAGFVVGGINFTNTFEPGFRTNFTLSGSSFAITGAITTATTVDFTNTAPTILTDTIALDMQINGGALTVDTEGSWDGTYNNREFHDLVVNGAIGEDIAGRGVIKQGESALTLGGANTFSGDVRIDQGPVLVRNAQALPPPPATITLNGTRAGLDVGSGLVISNDLIVANSGNAKYLYMEFGTGQTSEYAGTITLNDVDNRHFVIDVNSSVNNSIDMSQVLHISGKITGGAVAAGDNAIDTTDNGTLMLSNPSNDFAGNIRLGGRGSTLLVAADGALSGATVKLNRDTHVAIADGVNVTNTIAFNEVSNDDFKSIRLNSVSGTVAECSGNINFNDTSHNDDMGFHVTDAGEFNDPTQLLKVSGRITATKAVSIAVQGEGVVEFSGAANDITEGVKLNDRGTTLRISHSGALASSSSNQVILTARNTWLELADGVSVGPQCSLRIDNENNEHGLRIYNAQDGMAESATFEGNIETLDKEFDDGFIRVDDAEDTLTLTGVIFDGGVSNRLSTSGNGTIVFNGTNANTVSHIRLGTGNSTTWDGASGNKRGFVVVHRSDALGTDWISSQGSQIQAATTGINITNALTINNGGLRLGGTNDFELSGSITRSGGGTIGHYGLDGITFTLSGDIDVGTELNLGGSEGKDNGTLVFSGDLSGRGGFAIGASLDGGDVYLSGNNTYSNRTEVHAGALHIGSIANLGVDPTNYVSDYYVADGAAGLHVTGDVTFVADRGINTVNNGDDPDFHVFDIDAGKTFTVNSIIRENAGTGGGIAKAGAGTMILNGSNTYELATAIRGGTLVAGGGAAIVDNGSVIVSSAATFRLDANETIGSLISEGTVDLSGNTLTLSTGSDSTVNGTIAGGIFAAADGSALGGEAAASSSMVVLGSSVGVDLVIDGSTTNALTAGTLDISGGTQSVVLAIAPTNAAETITVANYGTLNGGIGNLQLQDAANYRSALLATNGSSITLNVGNEIHGWDNGSGTRQWDVGVSSNWTSGGGTYYDGDSIGFGDVGAGGVTLMADVAPGYVTFTNTAGSEYALAGSGGTETLTCGGGIRVIGSGDVAISNAIAGNTAIEHAGSGALTLGGTNTFTGGITVKPGATLKVTGPQNVMDYQLGAISQTTALTIENGGTFDINGNRNFQAYQSGSIIVIGAGVGGNGAIVNNGTADSGVSFADEITLAGDVTFGGTKRVDIDGTMRTSAMNVTIMKVGSARLGMNGNNRAASISEVVLNGGHIRCNDDNAFASATITINPGTYIDFYGNKTIGNHVILNGGRIQHGQNDRYVNLTGAIEVTADSAIDPNSNTRTIDIAGTLTGTNRLTIGNGTIKLTGDISGFTGAMNMTEANGVLAMNGSANAIRSFTAVAGTFIENGNAAGGSLTLGGDDANVSLPSLVRDGTGGGALSLTKTGTGTLTLTADNTYTGTTTVEGGALLITGDSTNATGAIAVNADGLIGGTGAVGGSVTIASGGGISVELNDSDTTLDCATLNVDGIGVDDCEFTAAGGHRPSGDYVLINADAPVSGSVDPGIYGLPGGTQGELRIVGNQLVLHTSPGGLLLIVR